MPCDVPAEAAVDGFAWDARDGDDPCWYPQGIAAARDGELLLVAWYARRPRLGLPPGARVTVVDRSDPARPRYRHVLLVVPRARGRLAPVRVHAGGLALVGDLLLVADTLSGVRAFRLDDVLHAPRGYAPRGHSGDAYAYVLPQLRRTRRRWPAVRGRFRFSFVSVDGEGLVAGEYGRAGTAPRLARWALDPATGLPVGEPVELHERQPHRMQGAAVHDGRWYVSASTGRDRPGDLHVGAPGAWRRHRGVLPPGPEDLTWSRPGERLWCLTEWPGRRWVFAVDARRWADGPAAPGGGA